MRSFTSSAKSWQMRITVNEITPHIQREKESCKKHKVLHNWNQIQFWLHRQYTEVLYPICCQVGSSVKPLISEASSELFVNNKHLFTAWRKGQEESRVNNSENVSGSSPKYQITRLQWDYSYQITATRLQRESLWVRWCLAWMESGNPLSGS